MESLWHDKITPFISKLSMKEKDWLQKPYSVSEQMKRCSTELTVQLWSQCESDIYLDEKTLLDCETKALLRQVYLVGDGIPFSYGRVVIPDATYQAFKTAFSGLGANLIGETLLYNNPDTKRGPFQYAYLTEEQPLFMDAIEYLKDKQLISHLCARRSIFYWQTLPLMVYEIYFPMIPDYPN